MRVSVLGPVVAEPTSGTLAPRDRVVLTALALHAGEPVSGERLADALWGEKVPASWSKVVQGCIVRLRKSLGPTSIETQPRGYRLCIPRDDLDVCRFERLLGRGRELLTLDQPERAMVTADEALALWRGPAFVDAEEWEPAQLEAHRLAELRMEAEELWLDAALRAGRHREVLASARAGVEAAPLRERRWALLAVAQYRTGRQGDALRTLNEARSVLARELGLAPGPDLIALEQAILRQDPALTPPAAPSDASPSCPWPGLLPYGTDDAEGFFGRDAETATCLRRLHAEGVVVVVGASGSGKSSLVRAGIAASLERDGRRVFVVTPGGAHPQDGLTAVPRGDDTVLVVDQCEEAVTLSDDPGETRAFFDAVVAHSSHAPLVVALRADRVGDVSAHAGFARIVEHGLFLLGPMSEANLRATVEGPARRSGLLLEPGLVDLVVRDVLDEPGALPLMSHALRQTWARREGRTLTVAAYRETGGIRGAVAQSAETVYADIDAGDRPKLRDLLLRLVSPSESSEPARARVPRRLLADVAGYEDLIERLVSARLVTSDDDVVELAHEALARAWPRLKDWLDEDVEGVRALRHLAAAASGWDALGRPDSELYRGVRLAQARAWRERTQPALTAVERAFLDASLELEAADLQVAQAQVGRERRTVKRLRHLVIGVATLAVVAVVASSLAIEQRQRADTKARIAEARRVSAEALVAQPYDRAILLALEAVHLWDSAETRGNLLTTIGRSPHVAGVIRSRGARLLGFDIAPRARRAAVVDNDGGLDLYDLATRARVASLPGTGVLYAAPAFSPNGADLAIARLAPACRHDPACSSQIDVLSASDLRPRRVSYSGLGRPAAGIAYSRDGALLAAVPHFTLAGPSDNIAIWRVGESDPLRRLTLPDRGIDLRATPDMGPPGWVAFSPDGSLLYASGAGPTTVFDVASGRALRSLDGLGALALSPDGTTIAVATASTGVALIDTTSGLARANLMGQPSPVTAAAFSADGRRIATASTDGTVTVWDTTTGERLRVLEGHSGIVLDVAFGEGSSTVYTSAADRSVFVWDVDGTSGLTRTLGARSLNVSTEAAVLVSPSADALAVLADRVSLVDLATKRVIQPAVRPGEVAWGAFSPDGRSLATVGWDGAVKTWRTSDGAALHDAPGRGHENFGAVAFSADGRNIVVADSDGTVVELRATTLRPTGRSVRVGIAPEGIRTAPAGRFAVTASPTDGGHGTEVVFGDLDERRVVRRIHLDIQSPRANFSRDGSRYAVGGLDGRLAVVDVANGKPTGPSDPVHAGPIAWVTFSPDGMTIASMGLDGDLTLSDADTGEPRARVRPGAANEYASVGYHPDGHTVLLGYRDGTVLAFETSPSAWVDHACRVAGRNLTADEWRDSFGDKAPRITCPTAG